MTVRKILFGSIVSLCVLFVVVTSAQVIQEKSEPVLRVRETSVDPEVNQKTDVVSIIYDHTEVDVAGGSVFINTGADRCIDVTIVPVPVGPEGSPVTTTILGDNTTASGTDCAGLGPVPVWWEAFEIDRPAWVTIDLCGTTPVQEPSYTSLALACTSRISCFSFLNSVESGVGAPICADQNRWMKFRIIRAGTFYYPVFSEESVLVNGRGPYEIHISAEELTDFISGPDVITGHIARVNGSDLIQLGREGPIGSGIVGLGLSTTSCNQGNELARWFELPDTNHPVMIGNMYKLHEVSGSDRLEQIGYSWFKHGFGSSNDNECGFGCFCFVEDGCGFPTVGAGCSDTYAGIQFDPCGFGDTGLMGPRSVIHPYTGAMPEGGNLGSGGGCFMNFPSADHHGHNHVLSKNGFTIEGISHRLQIRDVDLMPDLNVGSRYFAEGQYIVPDEYRQNNGVQNNNASHREFSISGPDIDGRFFFNPLEATSDQSPAVDAWPGAQQSLIEPIPMSDGQARLAYKVTDLGGGMWHYEYAVYNMNMDVSVGSLSLPVPDSATISNIEFFAPVHHAPETHADNYSNDAWVVTQGGGQLAWSTDSFATDPLANAVRWGTLYNFRFDANSPPQSQLATIGLFKTGGSIEVPTLVPQEVGATDCNNNGIDDDCDLNCALKGCNVTGCGESVDCDGTGVPDECEIDCNNNGIADSCDIAGGTSEDCTGNLIPDACEADCDSDGIADFCQIVIHGSPDINSNGVPDECDTFDPDPVLPDPDSPGGLACGAGPNYGQPCMTCTEGGRAGELCLVPDDCKDPSTPHPCEPNNDVCGEGVTCGSNTIAVDDVINIPWPKNRYIGFMPPLNAETWTGREIAIRVTLVVISHCDGGTDAGNSCLSDGDCDQSGPVVTCKNTGCNGEVRWVGTPDEFCEGTTCVKFQAAPLVADPVFVDWSAIGNPIQIYGEEITPGSKFLIQAIDIINTGALDIADNYSNALHVRTARWGDVVAPLSQFNAAKQPDINDVLALVGKWLSKLEPLKAISQLQPGVLTPADDVSVDDVLKGVNAWLSATYPFSVTDCP